MSPLDPELRRLIRWSRRAESPLPAAPPPFLAGRVVARWLGSAAPVSGGSLHRLRLAAACFSVLILLAGAIFWIEQLGPVSNPYDIGPAYELIARSIAP
jgi:hypothetical protein